MHAAMGKAKSSGPEAGLRGAAAAQSNSVAACNVAADIRGASAVARRQVSQYAAERGDAKHVDASRVWNCATMDALNHKL
jgi:hypothetical protein